MAEYIEREALEVELNHRLNFLMGEDGEYDHYTSGFDEAVTRVEKFPAADVAPVRHGRWDGDNCTVCKLPWNYNMTQDADDWGYFDPMPDYCPNCGAKMDEVSE